MQTNSTGLVTSLRVLGRTVSVKQVAGMRDLTEGQIGRLKGDVLELDASLPAREREATILHELMHWILMDFGVRTPDGRLAVQDEEIIVSMLASGLYAILADNNLLKLPF